MYAHIKYSNKNVKSNYQRFGVTFRDVEQEFDIVKDFKCNDHQFVNYDAKGKKKYWKDGLKRAKFILAQLLIDPNLKVEPRKGADESSKKNLVEVYEMVKKWEMENLQRELLTERLPDNRSKTKQHADRLKEQSQDLRDANERIKALERKINELANKEK